MSAALTGCSSGGSTPAAERTPGNPCLPIAHDLVAATQRYIDGFGVSSQPKLGASPGASPSPASVTHPMTQQEFADAVDAARNRLNPAGCTIPAFQEALDSGLQAVHSQGAIATAVLGQLRASLTGQMPSSSVIASATPHDNLAAKLAQMPDGSTLVLSKGTFRLPDTLVLLRSVTIRGDGNKTTIVTSAAPDAVVLALTSGSVNLSGLSLGRTGGAGSVLTAAPQAQVSLTGVHISGARTDKQGAGGVGVLLTAAGNDVPAQAVTFRVMHSSFTDNAAAGILAGGGQRISVKASWLAHNGQCAVCYLGASSGVLAGDTFFNNGFGVVIAASTQIIVLNSQFAGGAVAIEATGNSKPVIRDNTIKGASRASMLFTGNAAGSVDGNDCSGDLNGIAVARTAYPYVGKNKCRVTLGK